MKLSIVRVRSQNIRAKYGPFTIEFWVDTRQGGIYVHKPRGLRVDAEAQPEIYKTIREAYLKSLTGQEVVS